MYKQDEIEQWAKERGIYDSSDLISQARITVEESLETLQACELGDTDKISDGIGDVYVTLVNVAFMAGLDLKECIDGAYDEISQRQGEINPETGKWEKYI